VDNKSIIELVTGLDGLSVFLLEGKGSFSNGDLNTLLSLRDDIYLAFPGDGSQRDRITKAGLERILDSEGVGFVDRVKILTGGAGFANVLVLTDSPRSVRRALGIAAVLGNVYLLSPPAGRVIVDLHNTLHYKGLRVKAAGAYFPPTSGIEKFSALQ